MEKDLIEGCILGNIQLVRRALTSKHININIKNNDGFTILYLACRENNDEIVKLLIESNANVDISNDIDGDTPLIIACSEGYVQIVEYLLQAMLSSSLSSSKLTFTSSSSSSSSSSSIRTTKSKSLSLLQESSPSILSSKYKASINHLNKNGWTPLIYACYYGHYNVVKLLIDYHVDINMQSHHHGGYTALYRSCNTGRYEVVELLLKSGKKGYC